MAYADRLTVDEITQCDRALRFLLRESAAEPTQRLLEFLESHNPKVAGRMFLHENEEDAQPGVIRPNVMPALIMAPASLQAELWREPQAKLVHAVALVGLIDARNSEPSNAFVMHTLRALFQRGGRLPDTVAPHEPEAEHLDFVQTLRLSGPIQRTPLGPLSTDQESPLDEGGGSAYKTWGWRVVLHLELRAGLLQGG
ncbi:MAG: hypothetical protein IPK67_18715 [Planctomycetes bacterium]|nr:hypothetical protein [Planctomycetota bacterium]